MEVFVWLQILDKSLAKASRTSLDEEDTHFKTSVLYGQDKLEQNWDKFMNETPFYYGSVILHPYHKISWFKEKWHSYAEWLKTIEHRMKEVVKGYEEKLGGDAAVQRMKV